MRLKLFPFFPVLLFACAHAKPAEGPRTPLLSILRVEPQGETFSGMEFKAVVQTQNTSTKPCTIGKVAYALELAGSVKVADTLAVNDTVAPGAEPDEWEWTVPVEFGVTGADLQALLLKHSVPFSLTFTPEISGCALPNEPLVFNSDAILPQIPQVLLTSQRAGYYRDENAVQVVLSLGVKNPNPFSVRSNNLHYTVWISDKELAQGDMLTGLPIPAGAASDYDVTIDLTQATLGADLKKVIKEGRVHYKIDAVMDVPPFTGNQTLEGDVNFAH